MDLDLESVRAALAAKPPVFVEPPHGIQSHAAVALLLHQDRDSRGLELLFIERAQHEHDPWSGHMAFPGGRREEIDDHIGVTVAREVEEEIGAKLGAPLGRLDDYDARRGSRKWPLIVSPFVFALDAKPELKLNYEVASAVWIPMKSLLDPRSAEKHRYTSATENVVMPAVRHERFVIWGMTYKILAGFVGMCGRQMDCTEG